MHQSFRIALAALVLSAALPLAAQVSDTYVIPGVGNAPGAFNTRWMSQLSIFNPQVDYPLRVSVTYLPNGGGNGQEVIVTVPANSVELRDNVLAEYFGITNGSGALLVATFPEDNPGVPDQMIDRSFLVTSMTYNNASTGTYGQTVLPTFIGLQNYATDGISAIAHGIRNVAKFGWRTNFGAVNLGTADATLRITIYDADGKIVAKDQKFVVPRNGWRQWSLPVEVDRGAVEFFVDDPTLASVVFPYTSTIDQFSGDPTYQAPALLASAKSLYPKTAASSATIGHRFSNDEARTVRNQAERLGEVSKAAGH